MPSPIDKFTALAEPCVNAIALQLSLASKTAEDAMDDLWSLGYCFGALDAMRRRAELDQYTDGIALITVGFLMLAGRENGPDYLRRALDNQSDQLFFEGNYAGGSDIFNWANQKDYTPLMLMNYFTLGRPHLDIDNKPRG